ncbi:hypothetical protein GCM10023336_55260 [Streptomyces similanensis]|uniref:AAA family ATPase n=2 Tax=Streptomyces similanensis TaxID=1274988 RepID=A0ABP9L3I0_9ACTN
MPGITAPLRERRSRKPTNRPNPPIVLLTGLEHTGKRHEAAVASGSDLIGMTYWLQIGGTSGTADYYGRIPGARYEIVPHDGTFTDICDAVRWMLAQPARDGKRNMIVVDDVTALWDLLSDAVNRISRARADRRAQANGRRRARLDDPYLDTDRDLWNWAKDQWGEFLWLLRRHAGPTVIIARQEIVTAYENDKPTRHTTRRIKAEKNLRAAVDAVVEFHAVGEAYVTGVRTMEYEVQPGRVYRFAGLDHLLRRIGYEHAAPARQVIESRPEACLTENLPGPRPQPSQQQNQARRQPQPDQRPGLTGDMAYKLVTQALNQTDPEAALANIRKQWGTDTLRAVMTVSWFGELSADALISRSLQDIRDRAAKKKREGNTEQPGPAQHKQQPDRPGPSPAPAKPEQAREHQTHDEEPPPDDDDAPPPPDPQDEEPPPDESPEDTSAAEEPQDVPAATPPPTPQPPHKTQPSRKQVIARQVLMDEADVQARLKMMTLGEHLGPITEEGEPPLTGLRDYLQAQRPPLIQQLIEEGHKDLAEVYRTAPMPDVKIRQKFAAYFDGAPAGK